ncbi:MAG: RagB/SusD family nutrient uptake outer membrane protein [Bacteroidetes bacterium]|nr:RagB/SusD family nutrient uptake outer membrane protein [Bacteroidota bacterium]
MKHKIITALFIIPVLVAALAGCTKKLELSPTNDLTDDKVFATPLGYKQALAKVYGVMLTTGSQGAGSGDLPSEIISDAGNSDFYRNLWYLQCLSTDEAGWTYHGNTDPIGIHQMNWTSVNFSVKCSYYRSYYAITLANNFIQEASDDNLAKRGITGKDASDIKTYKQEARFLRAYHYWLLMDLFGNPPLITESTAIGSSSFPSQVGRAGLYNYIESELKDLESQLPAPKANEYGRVDQAAAWSLLARLYLNASTYIGTAKNTEAITYCNKVIGAGYTLHPKYKELMLADNNLNTDEFIWTLPYDGIATQTYGGTTFLIHGPAAVPGDSSGCSGTWGCIRITQQFVDLFDAADIRGQFYTNGQNKIMNQLLDVATDGYSSTKFRNKTRAGVIAPNIDNGKTFSSIDMPMFRLAEIYLIYAEAVVRGGSGGSSATALGYLQQLAVRARPSDPNAANAAQLTLNYILAERGRELMWEGDRRTDLIRYGQFTTGTYLWAWKGGVASGTAVDSKYNLYPIPSDDLTANPYLVQNPGY